LPSIIVDEEYMKRRSELYELYFNIDPESSREKEALQVIVDWTNNKISFDEAKRKLLNILESEEKGRRVSERVHMM